MPDSYFVPPSSPDTVADKLFNIVKQKNVYLTVFLYDSLVDGRNRLTFSPEPIKQVYDSDPEKFPIMTLGNYNNDESGNHQMWREASVIAMLLMTEGHNVFVGTLNWTGATALLPAYELYEDHLERIAEERSSR